MGDSRQREGGIYLDFQYAGDHETTSRGEPILNRYSTHLTKDHDFPGAKVKFGPFHDSSDPVLMNCDDRQCFMQRVYPMRRP